MIILPNGRSIDIERASLEALSDALDAVQSEVAEWDAVMTEIEDRMRAVEEAEREAGS